MRIKDKAFCMNSYLMFRYVYDNKYSFQNGTVCRQVDLEFDRFPVKNSTDLYNSLKKIVKKACEGGKSALALSGGIDSAILAKLVPEGTKAYTFRCIVPDMKVTDESDTAKHWAEINHLDHEIIDIRWEDIVPAAEKCMKHKGAPVHSIEAQIYVAAMRAVADGKQKFIFGENADIIYGGMDGLLEKDWLFSEFVDRYTYVMPYKVLREPLMLLDPYKEFERDGHIDGHEFINKYFRQEALGTYTNACEIAGIEFVGPYSLTFMDCPLDYNRIRSGDTKYFIRELFRDLYPGEKMPVKIPMPRPMNEWLASWKGPERSEFLPHCSDNMTGNQKWMIWCLERYLDMIEGKQDV